MDELMTLLIESEKAKIERDRLKAACKVAEEQLDTQKRICDSLDNQVRDAIDRLRGEAIRKARRET